ncbi:MAG: SurA N-terminal domain-containing protein, partial [Litorivicinaceae bacterium]|nr:SurA N-terminal domain-containing protein [Litorivicinaceae bacterium]
MLQNIRDNSSGIIAKIIVGLIAVTFVITGVNFMSGSDGDTVIAEVDGVEITERRFVSKLEQERRQLLSILGDPGAINEDLLRQSVLNALVEEAAATSYSEKLAFGVTDQLVDQVIVEIPQFQTEGRFDPRAFDRAIGQMGMSRLDFRDELKRNLIEYQVKGAVETSTLVTPSELARLDVLQNQKRSGELVVVKADQFLDQVTVADEEITSFYDANSSQFVTDESVALEYVLLSSDDFREQVTISSDDLRDAYDAEVAQAANESERRARHILIADSDDALEKAMDLKQKIDNGADFAELASEYSDDIASKETGGDLGFAPSGTFVPEFEAALNALTPNVVSDPVKTQYGYHLIELLESRARPVESFDARSPRLREELIDRQASQRLANNLEEFSNIAFSGTLEELNSVYGVKIQSTDLFGRSTATGLFSEETVLRRIFNETLYNGELNAEVFEAEPGLWMTFRVKTHEPKTVRSLAEVRDTIIERLRNDKAQSRAKALADAIQAHWKGGEKGLPTGA